MNRRDLLLTLRGLAPALMGAGAAVGLAPAAQAAGAKKLSGSENFVQLPGLAVSISHNYRFGGLITIDAGLDIRDAKMRARAEGRMPRLRAALREAISGYANGIYVPDLVPDADAIHGRMQKAMDRELGKGVARVALAALIVHPGK